MTSSSKPLSYYMSFTFGVHKNSPYKEHFNQGCVIPAIYQYAFKEIFYFTNIFDRLFHYLWQMGFFDFIRNRYFPTVNRCRADVKPEGKITALKLNDIASVFAFLGLGIGFSIFSFMLELIIGNKTRLRKKPLHVVRRRQSHSRAMRRAWMK